MTPLRKSFFALLVLASTSLQAWPHRKIVVHHRVPAPRVVYTHSYHPQRIVHVRPSVPQVLTAAALAALIASGGYVTHVDEYGNPLPPQYGWWFGYQY